MMSCFVVCAGVLAQAGAVFAKPSQPNIVFILADDLGIRDLRCYGSALHATPHIDELADAGLKFEQAYVAHPRCIPSRASLLTGTFPAVLGCPGGNQWRGGLGTDEVTLAEALRTRGYATAVVGKWHLAGGGGQPTEGMMPTDQGFDHAVAATSAGLPRSYFPPYDGPFEGPQSWRNQKDPIGLVAEHRDEYLTDRLTDEVCDFIEGHVEQNPDQPFFVYLSHYAVHQPIDAKHDATERYEARLRAGPTYDGPDFLPRDGLTKARQDDAGYAAMVESVDDSVGQVVALLNRLDIADDTIVVFTSDNGGLSNRGPEYRRDIETSNLPFRAGKGHLYEGGIRVPQIVSWLGMTPEGATSDAVTVNTDWFPTLLELGGVSMSEAGVDERRVDGVSITSVLRGGSLDERPVIFWHSPRGRPGPTGDENSSAIRVGDWKLIDYYDQDRQELFHMAADPYEVFDLSEAHPERVEQLFDQLDAWRREINAVGTWRRSQGD
ncbi:MAG: sulfatase [Planctomycetota bacterium]